MLDLGIATLEAFTPSAAVGLLLSAALGLLVGLRYKVPAVLAISAGLVFAGMVAAVLMKWSFGIALVNVLSIAIGFQCGYLLGLVLGNVATRGN